MTASRLAIVPLTALLLSAAAGAQAQVAAPAPAAPEGKPARAWSRALDAAIKPRPVGVWRSRCRDRASWTRFRIRTGRAYRGMAGWRSAMRLPARRLLAPRGSRGRAWRIHCPAVSLALSSRP